MSSFGYDLWKRKRPLLNFISIELTERCNNNCIHCYINLPGDDPAKSRELSASEIKRVLEECASLGCMGVMYTGGEPLLRPDFEELYVHTRKLGMTATIRTNATLITPRLAGLFAKIPPKDPIVVTAYGMTEETYEAVTRAPGSFEAFRKGVSLLVESNIPFELSSVVLPPNKKDMEDYGAWLSTLPCENKAPAYSLVLDLRGRESGKSRDATIRNLRLAPEEVAAIREQHGERYFKETGEFCRKFMRPPGDALFPCGAGLGSCSMDAYGYLQPCLQLRYPAVTYDVKSGSVKDALTRFFPGIRAMKVKNADYLARCARCFLKGLCEQCPAKSWMEHGTLDTPVAYLCEVAHAQARDLGLLKAGEKAWEVGDWRERINSLSNRN